MDQLDDKEKKKRKKTYYVTLPRMSKTSLKLLKENIF